MMKWKSTSKEILMPKLYYLPIMILVHSKNIFINLTNVEYINSSGIKRWVNFMEKLASFIEAKVFLTNCNRNYHRSSQQNRWLSW